MDELKERAAKYNKLEDGYLYWHTKSLRLIRQPIDSKQKPKPVCMLCSAVAYKPNHEGQANRLCGPHRRSEIKQLTGHTSLPATEAVATWKVHKIKQKIEKFMKYLLGAVGLVGGYPKIIFFRWFFFWFFSILFARSCYKHFNDTSPTGTHMSILPFVVLQALSRGSLFNRLLGALFFCSLLKSSKIEKERERERERERREKIQTEKKSKSNQRKKIIFG